MTFLNYWGWIADLTNTYIFTQLLHFSIHLCTNYLLVNGRIWLYRVEFIEIDFEVSFSPTLRWPFYPGLATAHVLLLQLEEFLLYELRRRALNLQPGSRPANSLRRNNF